MNVHNILVYHLEPIKILSKADTIKYCYLIEKPEKYGYIDEEAGILSLLKIKTICNEILPAYDVEYCYLFGSYAKGKVTDKRAVDLLIKTLITGLKFYDLIETLREKLKKRVDLLNLSQLNSNLEFLNEVLSFKIF